MTETQRAAEAAYSPTPHKRKSQHQRILDHIAEYGNISKWAAIYSQKLHCSKLATRISEIEDRCGHEFIHTMEYEVDSEGRKHPIGMRYSIPEGLTIEDFKF